MLFSNDNPSSFTAHYAFTFGSHEKFFFNEEAYSAYNTKQIRSTRDCSDSNVRETCFLFKELNFGDD